MIECRSMNQKRPRSGTVSEPYSPSASSVMVSALAEFRPMPTPTLSSSQQMPGCVAPSNVTQELGPKALMRPPQSQGHSSAGAGAGGGASATGAGGGGGGGGS